MLSLGLGYTLEPGLDIKTGAQRAQGTITGGGAPCYFATHTLTCLILYSVAFSGQVVRLD